MPEATIESLDHEGRGVAHVAGKAVFIDGALPGERVAFSVFRSRRSYELATAERILEPSSLRVAPHCPHFGICGGCSMQHLDLAGQAAAKQRVLEDALWHLARLRPGVIHPAVLGPAWGYRARARLSVRLVPKKGGVLVGFHERRSSYVAEMTTCAVLPPHMSALLPSLRHLIGGLSLRDRLPQIEVAVAESATALVLRILQPLTADDQTAVRAFADRHAVAIWLQPGGPDTAVPFHPAGAAELAYGLPDFGLVLHFRPNEFTQVNQAVNRMLVRRALDLLDPRPGERIGDLFCGLGNFTLPIASRGARVVGVEGSAALVDRARRNAALNGLAEALEFRVANLFETTEARLAEFGRLDKLLIDPPREGAIALIRALGAAAPWRIVYVSCSAATLARDSAVLVHEKGYRLVGAGIANMFPQTSHVESVALFER